MRRFALALLAASSLFCAALAGAATRPHYGGTLRVTMLDAPGSLDPMDLAQSGTLGERNLASLIFDTLLVLDHRGQPQPGLAISWQAEPGGQRWQFRLRPGVRFHDGTPLTADQVAASLRAANPNWKVQPEGDAISIQCDAQSHLPAELALSRNGIVKRGGTKVLGTGPFSVNQWEPGKKLMLAANNDYWAGRPYLDSIEITLGQGFREQLLALDLGKTDLAEVAPEQARRAASETRQIRNSQPVELLALVFGREQPSGNDRKLLRALSSCIDRAALKNVLLQGGGEPTGALLPNWMTGYGFLFPADLDLAAARQALADIRQAAPWTLGYETNDSLGRIVAERIVLNARDAGITLRLSNASAVDLRLERVPIASLDSRVALGALAGSVRLPLLQPVGDASQDRYAAERALLQAERVIPLLHLRYSYAMNATVQDWSEAPDGSWHLGEVWLSPGK